MEISNQLQQNMNKEIIPKNQTQDIRDTSSASQKGTQTSSTITESADKNINVQNIVQNETNALVQNQNLTFKEQLNQLNNQNSIYDFSFDVDFADVFSFSTNDIKEEDLTFFLNILEKSKNDKTIENIGLIPIVNNLQNTAETQETQTVQATEKVAQIVEIASKTGKPVRIDFDNQITVVLKVDNQGKINAHFYPGDKAAEEYLKNNIQNLRNTFDEKNILYSYLDYKQNKGNNGKERKDKQWKMHTLTH